MKWSVYSPECRRETYLIHLLELKLFACEYCLNSRSQHFQTEKQGETTDNALKIQFQPYLGLNNGLGYIYAVTKIINRCPFSDTIVSLSYPFE